MVNTKINTTMLRATLLVGLTTLMVLVISVGTTPVYAKGPKQTAEKLCAISMGIWDPAKETCTITKRNFLKKYSPARWILFVDKYCGESRSTTIVLKYSAELKPYTVACGPVAASNQMSLRQAGKCKLKGVDPSSAFGIDHRVTATFKGYPSYLRLRDGNQFYRLPVVAGSEHYAGGGMWTAEFDTANLLSGSTLAPTGAYQVTCVGPSGTAGGSAKINLTR